MNWIGRLLGFEDIPTIDVKKVLEESRQEARELFSDVVEQKDENILVPAQVIEGLTLALKHCTKYEDRMFLQFLIKVAERNAN